MFHRWVSTVQASRDILKRHVSANNVKALVMYAKLTYKIKDNQNWFDDCMGLYNRACQLAQIQQGGVLEIYYQVHSKRLKYILGQYTVDDVTMQKYRFD